MRSILIVLALLMSTSLTTGCLGLVTGAAAGPIMGGPSLTEKLYQSDASVGIKILVTPITFGGGAALGVFPGLKNGFLYDGKWMHVWNDPITFQDLFDPFSAGLFEEDKDHHRRGFLMVHWYQNFSAWRKKNPGVFLIGTSEDDVYEEKEAVNQAFADAKTKLPPGHFLEEFDRHYDEDKGQAKVLYKVHPEKK